MPVSFLILEIPGQFSWFQCMIFLYSFIQQIYLNSFYMPDTEKTTREKDEKDKLQTLKLKK